MPRFLHNRASFLRWVRTRGFLPSLEAIAEFDVDAGVDVVAGADVGAGADLGHGAGVFVCWIGRGGSLGALCSSDFDEFCG